MDEYEKLRTIFSSKNAPVAVRLFRAKSAPLILFLLRKEFKLLNNTFVTHNELLRRLTDIIEQLNFQDYADDYDKQLEKIFDSTEKASILIRKWSDAGYITYEPDHNGEYFHSLTSASEKVLQWLDSLQKEDFISTESKFKDIFLKLSEISENSTENWKEKVDALKVKKRDLESQMRQLEIEQKVVWAEDYYVKSRFNELSKLAQSLLADFDITALTFPRVDNSIVLFGRGYNISSLKHINWLKTTEIYYWSDMDVQGFEMLSQIRSYFPQTPKLVNGSVNL